jgi:hypothetical protein
MAQQFATVTNSEASPALAQIAPQPCIRSIRLGSHHDAIMRIGGEGSGAAGPF